MTDYHHELVATTEEGYIVSLLVSKALSVEDLKHWQKVVNEHFEQWISQEQKEKK